MVTNLCVRAAAVLAAIAFFVAPSSAATLCNTSTPITSAATLFADYEITTGTGPCFTIGIGGDLDMNGHSITCSNGSGCDSAILVNFAQGVQIKDGTILGDFTHAIKDYAPSSSLSTHVLRVIIDGADTAVLGGWKVERSIFKNIGSMCVETLNHAGAAANQAAGFVRKNYCESASDGFYLTGHPSSGGFTSVDANVVIAVDEGVKVEQRVDVTQNVIQGATPLTLTGGTPSSSQNICDDPDCNVPDATPFSFSLNW